ncbi:MerR family transcriptional regulator [Sphingomonas naphthae]|uniref:MerR family transcriptional regulator n=1 Tax=Sphingomonas naphthae TaxID=1813468 RepID=A0ABY7TPR9_9SPHN|nr:MerR family transcriptional regulator [Sphingomonas naphthae]WCT75232.1 MerR family transcriptional regulator [Sphingomonas naphthae]
MPDSLDIADVARRTGLTARALRFYEGRGLVRPLRSASGRRLYAPDDIERLGRIVALKAAGFSLADIGRLLAHKTIDLAALVEAQLQALDARAAELASARRLLLSAKSRIDRGEPLDAATLCSLIRTGDRIMEPENWKTVTDRYFTPEQKAEWADRMAAVPGNFDAEAYNRSWADLGTRIAAQLPLDPASPQAQALYEEWQALLVPFTQVATPAMMAGAANLYDRMPEWQGEQKPPFPMEVWGFIKQVAAARKSAT